MNNLSAVVTGVFFYGFPIFTRNLEYLEGFLWNKENWTDGGKWNVNFRRIHELPWHLQWSETRWNGGSVWVVCLYVGRLLCIICYSQSLLWNWRFKVSTFVPVLPSDLWYTRIWNFLRTWETGYISWCNIVTCIPDYPASHRRDV